MFVMVNVVSGDLVNRRGVMYLNSAEILGVQCHDEGTDEAVIMLRRGEKFEVTGWVDLVNRLTEATECGVCSEPAQPLCGQCMRDAMDPARARCDWHGCPERRPVDFGPGGWFCAPHFVEFRAAGNRGA